MAIRKKARKVVYKKAANKKQKVRATTKQKKQYAMAFIVGATVLVILAILFFRYAASNNYKDILGEKTYIEQQSPGTDYLR